MSCKITFESIITFREYDLLLILHTSTINVEFYSLPNTFYFIILCYIEQKIYLFLWRPAISSFKCPKKSDQQGSTRHLKVRTLKVNNFIYHLSIVPLHYTQLRQLIILTTTDVLVMTLTQRLISVSPSLLQSILRNMVSLYACNMLFIRPLEETHSMTVLCNDLTLLYLSPFNFLIRLSHSF